MIHEHPDDVEAWIELAGILEESETMVGGAGGGAGGGEGTDDRYCGCG